MSDERAPDLTRNLLQILCIGALIAGAFWVMRPMLPALIWATMMVVATWPLLLRAQALLWGRRSLAVALMTIALLLVLVVPLYAGVATIVGNVDALTALSERLVALASSPPPDWVEAIPLVGTRLGSGWRELTAAGPEALADSLAQHARGISGWVLAQAGSLGGMLLQFLLTIVIAAVLYANGEGGADLLRRFARRVGGAQGELAVRLAGQAIQAVALGVVVTAMVQSTLAGIGLAVAGVPLAGVLTALTFVLCVAQIGPTLVLLPAIIWVYLQGETGWAVALFAWTIPVAVLDNFLRPYLIRMGADLPLLLILPGVIGGLLVLGIIGLFIGPVLLAVGYTLLVAWMDEGEAA